MRMPREGEGTLHLDHLAIWIYTGNSLELPQLRDTSLYNVVWRLQFAQKSLSLPSMRYGASRVERGADSATR